MADLGDTAKKVLTTLFTPKGKTQPAAVPPAAPAAMSYDKLIAQYDILAIENAEKDAEINRLGGLKPLPVAPTFVTKGTIANLPTKPPAG